MSKKLWEASQRVKFNSNLYSFEQYISKKYSKKFNQNYSSILKWSISNSSEFWDSVWEFTKVKGFKKRKKILKSKIFYKDKLECEIAYFGILEEYIGKKFGGHLLSEAIKKSFYTGSKRVWVHTCSLDHKHALKNYLSRGMKIFKSEIINL